MRIENKFGYIDIVNYESENNVVYWKDVVGHEVKFKYKETFGIFYINDVIRNKGTDIYFVYNSMNYKLSSLQFKNGQFGTILKYKTKDFKFEIGKRIITEFLDITIIDRKYEYDKNGCINKFYHYRCNKCGFNFKNYISYNKRYEDYWLPEYKLFEHKCICCSDYVVAQGINDIPTTSPWMIKYFQGGYDEAKLYTCRSSKKIQPVCPDCKNKLSIKYSIWRIYNEKGVSCKKCGDGISFPNKIIFSLLSQLDIDFIPEKSFVWSQNKKYDYYVDNRIIIENHGEQHYKECSLTTRNLREEQENDNYKKQLALDNNISYYIVLDCRKYDINWIKKSVLESELPRLLNFTECDINWDLCLEYATKNIVKEICIYFNNNHVITSDIEKIFKLSRSTIINYLKIGNEVGWCNYNPKEEMKKCALRNHKKTDKPLQCLENGYVFSSSSEVEKNSENIFGYKIWKNGAWGQAKGKYKYTGKGRNHFKIISREQFNIIKH